MLLDFAKFSHFLGSNTLISVLVKEQECFHFSPLLSLTFPSSGSHSDMFFILSKFLQPCNPQKLKFGCKKYFQNSERHPALNSALFRADPVDAWILSVQIFALFCLEFSLIYFFFPVSFQNGRGICLALVFLLFTLKWHYPTDLRALSVTPCLSTVRNSK